MSVRSPDVPVSEPVPPWEGEGAGEGQRNATSSGGEQESHEVSDADIDRRGARAVATMQDTHRIREIQRDLGIDPFSANTEVHKGDQTDWTSLVIARMRHPVTKTKFLASKADILSGDAPYTKTGALQKAQETKQYHYDQIRTYDACVDDAALRTTYVTARDAGQRPEAAGVGREGGMVFSDAVFRGEPLTDAQKNLIEAHEKGHAMRTFEVHAEDIRRGFDFRRLPEDTRRVYMHNPDELVERMSQLKNYFGFSGDEPFTRQHLAFARAHYLDDVGFDNDMTGFFALITEETEDEFLRIINDYPI